jgi:hypothetical protein
MIPPFYLRMFMIMIERFRLYYLCTTSNLTLLDDILFGREREVKGLWMINIILECIVITYYSHFNICLNALLLINYQFTFMILES